MKPDATALSRRDLLAGVGAFGALSVVGFGLDRGPRYTRYTYAQTAEGNERVQVAWYARYNGEAVADQSGATDAPNATDSLDPATTPGYVPDPPTGPVVDLGGVMPGDSGLVAVGVLAGDVPENEVPVDVWFRAAVRESAENGRREPEIENGDATDAVGELADALRLTVWYDAGDATLGLGGCDGERNRNPLTDEYIEDLVAVDGTAIGDLPVTAVDDLFGGVDGSVGVHLTADGCLARGERRCLGIEWELPLDADDTVQTDGVELAFEFYAQDCTGENANPFAGGSA